MHIKFKQNQYWVWSSKKASLDCLPQYKFDSLEEAEVRAGIRKQTPKKVYEQSKMSEERIYSWAASLNK